MRQGTMTKEAEQAVIRTVKQAVDMVDSDGFSPDDALEKLARREGWGPEMVKFACWAYNNGRHTAQREASDSVLEKFADFPLARPDHIVARIWPSTPTSPQDESLSKVSEEYSRPPSWIEDRKSSRRKAAAAEPLQLLPEGAEKQASEISPSGPRTGTYTQGRRLERAHQTIRSQRAVAEERLREKMATLTRYFRDRPERRLPFAAVEHASIQRHGPAARSLLSGVYSGQRLKEARAADGPPPAVEVPPDAEPLALVDECVKLAQETNRWRRAERRAREALEKHSAMVTEHFRGPAQPSDDGSILQDAPKTAASSGGLTGSLGSFLGFSTSSPDTSGAIRKQLRKLDDPAHEQQLSQIKAQANLAELMDDEVIGSHDPKTVVDAYNEIAQLAPKAAKQPMVLRTLLRRRLEGEMEPFEAKEIADIEKSIERSDASPEMQLSGGGGNAGGRRVD